MKNNILLVAFISLTFLAKVWAQTDFAPVGAKWYYSEWLWQSPPPYGEVARIMEVTGEEVVQGRLCRKLETYFQNSMPNPCYLYTENDSVFYFSPVSQHFELLYDFAAEPGNTWFVKGLEGIYPDSVFVHVDSTGFLVINADTLKVWHVSYNHQMADWGDRIVEKIGNTCFLLPEYGLYEQHICNVRCWLSPPDDYHFVNYPCDAFISATNEAESSVDLKISPNPASSFAWLELPECQGCTVGVFDVMGRWVQDVALEEGSVRAKLEVLDFVPGIYFLRIRTAAGKVVTRALAVAR